MDDTPALHNSIVALVALAANIAANHPKQGLCQLEKLRDMGVPELHIQTVIDIARHIRDEAGEKLDADFDEKAAALTASSQNAVASEPAPPAKPKIPKGTLINIPVSAGTCCTPTKSGQSCC